MMIITIKIMMIKWTKCEGSAITKFKMISFQYYELMILIIKSIKYCPLMTHFIQFLIIILEEFLFKKKCRNE